VRFVDADADAASAVNDAAVGSVAETAAETGGAS
jgi:hypothetical protein